VVRVRGHPISVGEQLAEIAPIFPAARPRQKKFATARHIRRARALPTDGDDDAMTRAILLGITTALLAASGCDPEGGSPDDETTFRQNVVYVAVKTQTSSFSAGSCDPDWWFVEACGAEFDEKDRKSV